MPLASSLLSLPLNVLDGLEKLSLLIFCIQALLACDPYNIDKDVRIW